MKSHQLTEHNGADMPARFYVDGRRVGRAAFDAIRNTADRLDCFSTKTRQVQGGRFRRTNYSVATFA